MNNGNGIARAVSCESPETHREVWKGVGSANARCLACRVAEDLDYRRTPATERELEMIAGTSTRRCLTLLHAEGRITAKPQAWAFTSTRPVTVTPKPLRTPEQEAAHQRQMRAEAEQQERMAREAAQRSSMHAPPVVAPTPIVKRKQRPEPEPVPSPWERAGVPAIELPPPPPPVLTTRDPGYWTEERRKEWAQRTEAQRAAQRAARSAAPAPDGA